MSGPLLAPSRFFRSGIRNPILLVFEASARSERELNTLPLGREFENPKLIDNKGLKLTFMGSIREVKQRTYTVHEGVEDDRGCD